jgi:uncharacterized protein YijF (DUF1287 family)
VRSLILSALLAVAPPPARSDLGTCLVDAARRQIGVTRIYDGSYVRLAYPGGDVPAERGVCTDVVVRAYRTLGVDLQQRVHEDMTRAWDSYPGLWGLARPDRNIDHRRVPNLAAFFARHGESLPQRDRAGDLVTWRLPSGVPHVGIVSDRSTQRGTPRVVHNIGRGTLEEDVLEAFPVTGHFRYRPEGARCPDGVREIPAPPE